MGDRCRTGGTTDSSGMPAPVRLRSCERATCGLRKKCATRCSRSDTARSGVHDTLRESSTCDRARARRSPRSTPAIRRRLRRVRCDTDRARVGPRRPGLESARPPADPARCRWTLAESAGAPTAKPDSSASPAAAPPEWPGAPHDPAVPQRDAQRRGSRAGAARGHRLAPAHRGSAPPGFATSPRAAAGRRAKSMARDRAAGARRKTAMSSPRRGSTPCRVRSAPTEFDGPRKESDGPPRRSGGHRLGRRGRLWT